MPKTQNQPLEQPAPSGVAIVQEKPEETEIPPEESPENHPEDHEPEETAE